MVLNPKDLKISTTKLKVYVYPDVIIDDLILSKARGVFDQIKVSNFIMQKARMTIMGELKRYRY